MRKLLPILALLLASLPAAHAAGLLRPSPVPAPGQLCRQAIRTAEQAHGIQAGLLAAMARVESGRPDPRGGAISPWPWTINVEGQGAFFETAADAIAAVRASQARGVRSIDIGCLQVNLMHHPHAFASLAQAFDPAANADYAARFLRDLFNQSGSWPQAAALYHSATPELGAEYRRRVLAAWAEENRLGRSAASQPLAASWTTPPPKIGLAAQPHAFAGRIPTGWSLAPHFAVTASTPGQAACPFAALVGCNRIHPRATH